MIRAIPNNPHVFERIVLNELILLLGSTYTPGKNIFVINSIWCQSEKAHCQCWIEVGKSNVSTKQWSLSIFLVCVVHTSLRKTGLIFIRTALVCICTACIAGSFISLLEFIIGLFGDSQPDSRWTCSDTSVTWSQHKTDLHVEAKQDINGFTKQNKISMTLRTNFNVIERTRVHDHWLLSCNVKLQV